MPFPVAAAIGAAGSVLGSFIGGSTSAAAQRRANATNLQIARETNAQNYRIFQEQQQFNENQFNRWLDYSTPAAQRQRYEDAGINPYLAVGQLQNGTPSSALTSANSAPMQGAQVQPVQGLGDALQNSIERAAGVFSSMISSISDADLKGSQKTGTDIDNKTRGRQNEANIQKTNAETGKSDAETRRTEQENSFFDSTLEQRKELMNISVDTAKKQKELLDHQVMQVQLQNAMSNIDLGIATKYKDVMFKQQLSNLIAQEFATYQNVAQGWKHVSIEKRNANTNAYNAKTNRMNANTNAAVGAAQVQSLVANAIESAARTSGIKIDNQTKGQLNRTILQGLGFDNIDKNNKNKAFWWNFGFEKAEQLSRIGVNGSQMYYNFGAGSEKFTKAASPGHYLLGW
jgi:hypothetical protein|nr:MAG TPA: hypothetical protein [Microviridae sp.]